MLVQRFENEQRLAVICYRTMLNEFWFTKIELGNIGNLWFQQDSASCHTPKATFDVFRPVFEDRPSAVELMSIGHLGVAIVCRC